MPRKRQKQYLVNLDRSSGSQSGSRKAPCWSLAASLFTSLYFECSWEAWQVEFTQVMGGSERGCRGVALSSLLILPAGSGIKSAQLCRRRQRDSCFLWLWEKHMDSLPLSASFRKRWSVAKTVYTSAKMWTVEKGQQQRGYKGNKASNDMTNFSAVSGF